MEQVKATPFPSLLRKSKTKPVEVGEKIYKWNYLDTKGELKEDTTNTYEKIQSFARQVDYKLRIARNEEIEQEGGLYVDTSVLGTNYDTINEYLARVAENLKTAIQQGQNQVTQQDTSQGNQTSSESGQNNEGGQVTNG